MFIQEVLDVAGELDVHVLGVGLWIEVVDSFFDCVLELMGGVDAFARHVYGNQADFFVLRSVVAAFEFGVSADFAFVFSA